MEKIEKYMKQTLKNKVKITKAAIIAILITGGITAPKITRADTPNEKAVDIFKDLNVTNKTSYLQELVNDGEKFKNDTRFESTKKILNLDGIITIAKNLINDFKNEKGDYSYNIQDAKNKINEIQTKLFKFRNSEVYYSEENKVLDYIDTLALACNDVIAQKSLDKHTYKNQMDRLAKIVDKNSEKVGAANENHYQYYITNENEKHGLELGDNSQARGHGSIVTSENGMATGKGAVATGGDNTSKEDIERKLKENQEKLNEIDSLKKTNATLTNQLSDLQLKEQDVIQAGIRVEQIRKAKANAEKEAERLKSAWQTEVDGSKEFFKNYQAKIDDLNSRLTGVGKLKNNDIQTPEGLEKAITEFKHNVEDGTKLNLSRDFYKDYITSYYKALGDLRLNNATNGCIGKEKVLPNGKKNTIKNIIDANFLNRDLKDIVIQYDYSISSYSSSSYSSSYNSLGEYSVDENGIGRVIGLRSGGYQEYNGKLIKIYKDVKGDLTTQEDYDLWKSVKDGWKAQIHDANKRSGSEFFGKFDTLTSGKSTILFNMVTDMKFELVDLDYEITYDQWKYEQTHDVTWLDKKRECIDKRQQKLDTNEKILKDKYKELFGEELKDTSNLFNTIGKKIQNDWKKENIDNVENKNKITTEKLTSELEKALGVNKNTIKERQAKLDEMKSEYEQAERNAKGLNPSEKDLILSKEYERVKAEIEQMTNTLKTNQEKLKALKEALTLYDLKNKGKDNIAYGTDTLAVGDNAIAFGKGTKTVGENSISFGVDLLTTGNNNTNVGQLSQVSGEKNQVMGYDNKVNGNQNLVFGNNIKIGTETQKVNNNLVFGTNITIDGINNAIVFGNESKPIEGAVSFGNDTTTRKLKYIAKGTDDTDAVNVKQLQDYVRQNLVNVQGADTNITNLLKNKVDKTEYDTEISNINKKIVDGLKTKLDKDGSNLDKTSLDKLTNKLSGESDISNPKNRLVTDTKVKQYLDTNFKIQNYVVGKEVLDIKKDAEKAVEKAGLALGGVANAIAMANLTTTESGIANLTAAYGTYGKEHALAIGFNGNTPNRRFNYKFGLSTNMKGNLGIGAGVGFVIGGTTEQRQTQQERKIKALEKQLQEMSETLKKLQLKNNEKTKESIEKH